MSDIDLSGGTSPSSTPSGGSTPVSLDPNALYSIPGFDTPLSGERVKDGIMLKADHTRKTQQLVEKARELDTILGQAQYAMEIAGALEQNPEQAIAELAQIYLGAQATPVQAPAQQQPGQQTGGISPEVVQLVESYLGPVRQENEQLKGQLYGYIASNQLEREWKGLESRDPRVASDPAMRARLSQVAAQRGLPLEDAYKLATWDEVQQQAEQAASEARARTLRNFIPSIGGGARPGNGGQAPPVDSQKLFEQSFLEALKEEGFID